MSIFTTRNRKIFLLNKIIHGSLFGNSLSTPREVGLVNQMSATNTLKTIFNTSEKLRVHVLFICEKKCENLKVFTITLTAVSNGYYEIGLVSKYKNSEDLDQLLNSYISYLKYCIDKQTALNSCSWPFLMTLTVYTKQKHRYSLHIYTIQKHRF